MNLWDNLPVEAGGGGVWEHLAKDMIEPVSLDPEAGLGVWGQVSVQPSGLWSRSRDETLVLAKVGVGLWDKANEETLILARPAGKSVWQDAQDQSDTTAILPRKKTDMWDQVENETLVLGHAEASLWSAAKIRDKAHYKPARTLGWALKQLETASGEEYYILKNLRLGTYLRLSEQQVYLWNLMDGSYTVQDLVVENFMKYGSLSVEWLASYLGQLEAKGFLTTTTVDVYQASSQQVWRRSLDYWVKKCISFLFSSELSIKTVDPFYTALYRLGGWVFYTRPVQILLLLVTLAGLPAFVYLTQRGDLSVFEGASSTLSIGLVGLLAAQIFTVFAHESAHALTTKRYNRQVRRGGVGLYFGMLTFFMDTTDIWMEPRKPRLAVTWAGPYSGFILGGLASLALLFSPTTVWAGIAYQFATFCYLLSFVNLNPLLKLDGYYLLMDWLEIPMLRERSMTFIQNQLWPSLRARRKLGRDEKIYTVFGILAVLWTGVALISMIDLFGGTVFDALQGVVGTTLAWIILAALAIGLGGVFGGSFIRRWLAARRLARI